MWLRTKWKKLKSLVRFHSANKINKYTRGREKREKKRKKIQTNLQSKSKYKKNKRFSWVTALRVLSLAGSHSPHLLSRMPSNTADLWTCCERSSESNLLLLLCVLASNVHSYQIWCVLFCGSSQQPFIYSTDTSLPSWSCRFNLQLVQLVGEF